MLPEGHVLAWVDDRSLEPGLYVQRVDPTGRPVATPRRIPVAGAPRRPRLASDGSAIVLVYGDLGRDGAGTLEVRALDADLDPLVDGSRSLGSADRAHGAGLTLHEGAFLVARAAEGGVELTTLRISRPARADGGGATDAGALGDGGRAEATDADAPPPGSDGARVTLSRRTVRAAEDVAPLGNLALLSQGGRLFMASDTPEGWSIQLLEVGRDEVRKIAQVVDDRRHPDLYWCCPALGPIRDDSVALLWQGPTPGLTSLHFLGFDADGEAMGNVVLFEAFVRDEEEENRVGRAPAFDPALSTAPYGLLAAFSDNRYANSEILLAPLTCTE